ncbi:hypothetical protein M514_00814 [Trichuris suis]|uniref:Uncharacterized protein n=1 Tax=Trichuris suis TaxID=68888 RepID=A0A085N986_9BILA|nr:hypothetical protein M514_00814 [Trichuris suis]
MHKVKAAHQCCNNGRIAQSACSFACNVFPECCILLISCTTLKTGRVLVKEDIAVESVWNNGRVA